MLRKLVVRLLLLIVVGVPVAAALLYSLAVSEQPLIANDNTPTSMRAERAQALIKALDPRGAPDDRIRTLQLTGSEVELVSRQVARRFGVATEIVLQDQEALVRASAPVPQVGGYFNVSAVVGETSTGLPRIETLRVGQVSVPTWVARRAVPYLASQLARTELRDVPVDTIKSVSIGEGLLRIEYEWQPGLETRIAALAMPKADVERLREYHDRIAHTLDDLPSRPTSVLELASPVMKLAAERSEHGDPVAENRAAFLAMAFYLVGTGPAALVPEAREWSRTQPHAFLIEGRDDLTRAFATSAALAVTSGTPLAAIVGKYRDAGSAKAAEAAPSSMAADRAGALLGKMAMQSPQTARLLQTRLSQKLTDADFLPDLKDLDGMSTGDLAKRFGGSSPEAALTKEIDRRLASTTLFK